MKEKHINTQTLFIHRDVLHPEYTLIQPCSIRHHPLQHTVPPMSWGVARGGAGLTYKPWRPQRCDGCAHMSWEHTGRSLPVCASFPQPAVDSPAPSRDSTRLWQPRCQAGNAQAEEQQQSSEPAIISEPAQSDGI